MESADSDVADMTELEKLDRPEAGLEKRAGPWPLHLSSTHEQAEPGLTLLHVLPLTTADAAEDRRCRSCAGHCVFFF